MLYLFDELGAENLELRNSGHVLLLLNPQHKYLIGLLVLRLVCLLKLDCLIASLAFYCIPVAIILRSGRIALGVPAATRVLRMRRLHTVGAALVGIFTARLSFLVFLMQWDSLILAVGARATSVIVAEAA